MQTKCKIYHACKYNIIVHLNEALPLSDMKKNHWNLTGLQLSQRTVCDMSYNVK